MAEGRRDPDRMDPWEISRGTTTIPPKTSGQDEPDPTVTWALIGFFLAVLFVCLLILAIILKCQRGDANPGVVQLLNDGINFSLAALRLLLRV